MVLASACRAADVVPAHNATCGETRSGGPSRSAGPAAHREADRSMPAMRRSSPAVKLASASEVTRNPASPIT